MQHIVKVLQHSPPHFYLILTLHFHFSFKIKHFASVVTVNVHTFGSVITASFSTLFSMEMKYIVNGEPIIYTISQNSSMAHMNIQSQFVDLYINFHSSFTVAMLVKTFQNLIFVPSFSRHIGRTGY